MNGNDVLAALLSLAVFLLGSGIVAAIRAWNKMHKCMDDHFKKVDEKLIRIDEWKNGHEKRDEDRFESLKNGFETFVETWGRFTK